MSAPTRDKIVRAIARMRDRDALAAIMDAATARDSHLMAHQSYRISKRVFERFAHLKRGDAVYVHAPEGKLKENQRWMAGKQLIVWAVHPRNRQIEVRAPGEMVKAAEPTGRHTTVAGKRTPIMREVERPRTYLMRWRVLEALKVSTQPTAAALGRVLQGGKS